MKKNMLTQTIEEHYATTKMMHNLQIQKNEAIMQLQTKETLSKCKQMEHTT